MDDMLDKRKLLSLSNLIVPWLTAPLIRKKGIYAFPACHDFR